MVLDVGGEMLSGFGTRQMNPSSISSTLLFLSIEVLLLFSMESTSASSRPSLPSSLSSPLILLMTLNEANCGSLGLGCCCCDDPLLEFEEVESGEGRVAPWLLVEP